MNSPSEKYALLIEDDALLSRALELKFKKGNLALKVIGDGKDALDFLRGVNSGLPAVVLLDLMLPRVSGFEILEVMRRTKKWEDVLVVILSNLGQMNDLERAKQLKISDYLVKTDVKLDEILDKTAEYLK